MEQINRKRPKFQCEVSSALQLECPEGFLVILKKRWCFVWQNIPVRENKSRICSPTSHPPASLHYKSGRLFHAPFAEHPLTISCTKGLPQWLTAGKGKETGWLQPCEVTFLSLLPITPVPGGPCLCTQRALQKCIFCNVNQHRQVPLNKPLASNEQTVWMKLLGPTVVYKS